MLKVSKNKVRTLIFSLICYKVIIYYQYLFDNGIYNIHLYAQLNKAMAKRIFNWANTYNPHIDSIGPSAIKSFLI